MKQFYEAEIRQRLDAEEKYRDALYPRGYLITQRKLEGLQEYPFYGLWDERDVGGYFVYTQKKTTCFIARRNAAAAVLIGHAFDPFSDVLRETEILDRCLEHYEKGRDAFFEAVNDLTGIFVIAVIDGDRMLAVQDCAGMQMLYYGTPGGQVFLSSSPQLVADVCGLERDPFVVRLLNSKSYYRGSRYLPGNLCVYSELTRLGPNLCVEYDGRFAQRRFFPTEPRRELREEEKPAAVERIYAVFRKSIELTLRKWDRVGLSLSGGVDSKTTLACADGLYDRFFCYSYASKPSEKADADAAREICRAIGLPHRYYVIPESQDDIEDYSFLAKLIDHNTSYLMRLNDNELRKYIWFFHENDDFVEMKSDSSEIGRGIMAHKYGVRLPAVLTPRHLSIFQARYFLEPGLMRAADHCNRAFMRQTGLDKPIFNYEDITLFFWEVRLGSWYATSFFSQQFYRTVTVPYNNRRLMSLFYEFPYEDRLEDRPHKLLMQRGNPKLAALDIHVKDSYFGKKRVMLETLYYLYATRLNTFGKKTR